MTKETFIYFMPRLWTLCLAITILSGLTLFIWLLVWSEGTRSPAAWVYFAFILGGLGAVFFPSNAHNASNLYFTIKRKDWK